MYDPSILTDTRPEGPAPRSGGGSGSGSLMAIVARIEEAIDAETAAIRSDPGFDVQASNARKSRCLYELNRAIKGAGTGALSDEHRAAVERLRDKLAVNAAALQAHLSAVGEVAGILQGAIAHSEADGTYSAGAFGSGRAA